jgi:hypothetical protein
METQSRAQVSSVGGDDSGPRVSGNGETAKRRLEETERETGGEEYRVQPSPWLVPDIAE